MIGYYLHGNGVPFQQIKDILSIKSTKICTAPPKITQQILEFPLSMLRSTLTYLNFFVVFQGISWELIQLGY